MEKSATADEYAKTNIYATYCKEPALAKVLDLIPGDPYQPL